MVSSIQRLEKRTRRNRYALRQKNATALRLTVHRTNKAIYAQLIDDVAGITVAAASSRDESLKLAKTGNKDAAFAAGKLLAERAKKVANIGIFFDRGGYLFHGRVKALADGAREGGLAF